MIARGLKILRCIKGYGQADIADRVNIDKSYVALLETGKRTPSLEVLTRIANVFGVTIDVLIVLSDFKENIRSLSDEEIVRIWRQIFSD